MKDKITTALIILAVMVFVGFSLFFSYAELSFYLNGC